MKRKIAWLAMFLLVGMAYLSSARAAETSQVIAFTECDTGLTGAVDLRLRLFTAGAGGTMVFEETQTGVDASNPCLSVGIGNATAGGIPATVFSANPSLWIAFALDNNPDTELGDRTPITANGYAFKAGAADRASNADQFGGVPSSGFVRTTGGSISGSTPTPVVTVTNSGSGAALTALSQRAQGVAGIFQNTGGGDLLQGKGAGDAPVFRLFNNGGASFSGNVGIGTDSPIAKLHVSTTGGSTLELEQGLGGEGDLIRGWSTTSRRRCTAPSGVGGTCSGDSDCIILSTCELIPFASEGLCVEPAGQRCRTSFDCVTFRGQCLPPRTERDEVFKITRDGNTVVRTPTGNYGFVHTDGDVAVGSWAGTGSSGGGGWYGTKSDHPLHFFTANGPTRMTIARNGNVGIGTTSPGYPLTVLSTNRPGLALQTNRTNEWSSIWFTESGGAGRLAIQKELNNDLGFWTATGPEGSERWTQRMRLTPSGILNVRGRLVVQGPKSAAVDLPNGDKVLLYAMESPGNWFEDFGSAQLINGVAVVEIDPVFVQTVNTTDEEYHVFLTPRGPNTGLYMAQQTPTSFEVRDGVNGGSNVRFSYRIIAKRKDYEKVRLEKMDLPEPETIK
jgi:hypothetical protein